MDYVSTMKMLNNSRILEDSRWFNLAIYLLTLDCLSDPILLWLGSTPFSYVCESKTVIADTGRLGKHRINHFHRSSQAREYFSQTQLKPTPAPLLSTRHPRAPIYNEQPIETLSNILNGHSHPPHRAPPRRWHRPRSHSCISASLPLPKTPQSLSTTPH